MTSMPRTHNLTNAEQCAIIDQAVGEGWQILKITAGNDGGGTVKLSKNCSRSAPPMFSGALTEYLYLGIRTENIELGVGSVALEYARDIMSEER